eukprot:86005-Prymnesium_polylepis.1
MIANPRGGRYAAQGLQQAAVTTPRGALGLVASPMGGNLQPWTPPSADLQVTPGARLTAHHGARLPVTSFWSRHELAVPS